jgi:hypothetical protein
MVEHETPITRKRKSEELEKENKPREDVCTDYDSQESGPSDYKCGNPVSKAASLHTDTDVETDEEEISEEEKCCVCKNFTPDDVRNSVSISFAKLVKYDR